ncbi:MAG: flagellar biosynthetic protein FliO [Pseudomonadota bacterium]
MLALWPGAARAAMAEPVVAVPRDAAAGEAAVAGSQPAQEPPFLEGPAAAPATGEAPDERDDPRGSTVTALVRMVLVLAGIILLAYLILHKGMGSLSAKLAQGRLVHVVDRVGLEPKKTLYVVEIAGRYYLIGTSDHGVSCLATLSGDADRSGFENLLRTHRGAGPVAAATDSKADAAVGGDGGRHG